MANETQSAVTIFGLGDIIAIIAYFIGIILLGVWTTKKIKKTDDYFVGGRSMPGWAVGLSLLGTAISSVTFLAYPGSAYEGNWSRLVQGLMLPVAALIGITFFVVYYRRSLFVSAYQYFEKRFGSWGRSYASLIYLLGQIFRMGTVLFLLATAIKVMTNWDILVIIIIVGILVTIYTVLGGIEAVIWTDVVQTIVLILGGIATIGIVFYRVEGGMFEVFRFAANNGKFDLTTSWDFDLTLATFWVFAFSGIIGNIQEFSTDQIKIQRYAAPSTDKGAKRAAWTVGLGCIPVWTLFMFVGTCLWVYYQVTPEPLGAEFERLKPDQIFPYFILSPAFPSGFGGLVLAAVMAAAMSTIDSSLNASATVISVDWFKRFFVKDRSDEYYLKSARIITIIMGVLMIFSAFLLTKLQMKTFLDLGFFLGAVFAGGIGGLFLLGFFFKRANGQGAIVGVVVGVIVILWLTFSHLAHYVITDETLAKLPDAGVKSEVVEKLQTIEGKRFELNDLAAMLRVRLGEDGLQSYKESIIENAEHIPARYVITDSTLAVLSADSVQGSVLEKLKTIQRRRFTKEDLIGVLNKTIGADATRLCQDRIIQNSIFRPAFLVISGTTFGKLAAAEVPSEIIDQLRTIEDVRYKEVNLIARLKKRLGEKDAAQYTETILKNAKHSNLLPQSLVSSTHPFIINVFGNLTVLFIGLLASLFWPAPTETQLKRATWWTRNK
ncbi:sodium/solute symporter [candidate division KSB1 bacterium]|nr:sodium/solute symporter [candidate division KSB1 bacterium]